MKTLTAKYEKLILEKDNFTLENEKLKKDLTKKEENVQLLLNEKNSNINESSALKSEILKLKEENQLIMQSTSEKTHNVSNLQIEKQIMKNQELEMTIEKLAKEKEN